MSVTASRAVRAEGSRQGTERRYTIWYEVETNDRHDGPITAINAPAVALYGAPYQFGSELDGGALRGDVSATLRNERESMRYWTVQAQFSTRPLANPQAADVEDPVLLPPEVSGDFLIFQQEVERDKDGNSILNSAKEFFDGQFADESMPTLTIAKNYSSISLATMADVVPSVNSTDFWGLGPRYWKLTRAPWRVLWKANGIPYYNISFEFTLNWKTWDFKPADRGWNYYVSNVKRKYDDDYGVPTGTIGYLDGDANKLDTKTQAIKYWDGVSTKDSGGVMSAFRYYRERDYAILGIPTSF